MHLQNLRLTNLRSFDQLSCSLSPQINLIHGPNGSGKSTLLEGVCLLSLGRSFRTHQLRHLVREGATQITSFGTLVDALGQSSPLGVERTLQGDFRARYQGRNIDLAELASLLPVQVIDANSFNLLDGSPAERRQFLDWGGFHQTPQFISVWRQFQRALKQRNSLLKHGKISHSVREIWDQEFVSYAEQLTALRVAYIDVLLPHFNAALSALSDLNGLEIRMTSGWDRQRSLKELLEANFERDLQQGFTSVGPQRADLKLKIQGRLASEHLSRGQKKLVVSALKLAQGAVYTDLHRQGCVYLIDDLPAELDQTHMERFCSFLYGSGAQSFITSVDPEPIMKFWPPGTQGHLFQLEAGSLVSVQAFGDTK